MASKGKTNSGKKSNKESKGQDIVFPLINEDDEDEPNYCGSCSRLVTDEDDAILCDICEFWHHIECEKVDENVYQFLQQNANSAIQWYCQKCNRTAKAFLKSLSDVKLRQTQLEERFDRLDASTNKKLQDFIKKEDLSTLTVGSQTTSEIVGLALDEIYERERRADNLMFFNVKESNSDIVEERKEHDMNEIGSICNALEVDITGKVKKATRIGKKIENQCRPLKVLVNDIGAKRMIKSKAKNLRNHPTLKNVFISSDLTPLERKQVMEKKKTRKEQAKTQSKQNSKHSHTPQPQTQPQPQPPHQPLQAPQPHQPFQQFPQSQRPMKDQMNQASTITEKSKSVEQTVKNPQTTLQAVQH